MGCSSCETQVQSLIEAKQESGEDISEDERKIIEGESKTPMLYGPLAWWVDIPWCRFCFTTGVVLSFAIDILLWVLVAPHVSFITKEVLVVFLGVELLLDGFFGRYPILGAVFGPVFERIFAAAGIYLTWDAVAMYGPGVGAGVTPIFTQGYKPSETQTKGNQTMNTDNTGNGGSGYETFGNAPGGKGPDFQRYGTEIHVVPTDAAVETCADPQTPGALIRVVVEKSPTGTKIKDIHPWYPEYNAFENIEYHVNPNAKSVCAGEASEIMTFTRFQQTQVE